MNLQIFKASVKRIPLIYWVGIKILEIREKIHPIKGHNNILKVKGHISKLKKSIVGDDNVIDIKDSTLIDCSIRIRGNGNRLVIKEGCSIGKGCSFWLEGNNNNIVIGKNTTMTMRCHFNAQEHDTNIVVGEDCMFSNSIVVRTSDSHPIFNAKGERINPAQNVIVGNHVWIAPSSVIMKGAEIGNGCIIGSHSMVNKTIPEKCMAVGMPAKVVKEEIRWSRENVLK